MNYDELKTDVSNYNNQILKLCETEQEIGRLFLGMQILYSPLIIKPEILLIGINPGPGYFNQTNGCRIAQFEELKELEYLGYDYVMARETKEAFKQAGLSDILQTSVAKTNIYFLATRNVDDLASLTKQLREKNILNPELQAIRWIKELLNIIKPKIIICEGAKALEKLSKFLIDRTIYMDSKQTKVVEELAGYKVIAYSRTYSKFQNMDEFVEILKNEFKDI